MHPRKKPDAISFMHPRKKPYAQPHSETRDAWLDLPDYLRDVFPQLKWNEKTDGPFSRLPNVSVAEERVEHRGKVGSFEARQIDRYVWQKLVTGDVESAATCIQETSRHMRVDAVYHTQAHHARADSAVMQHVHPALEKLADLGIEDMRAYGSRTGTLEDFRKGYVKIVPAIRIDTSLIPHVEEEILPFLHAKEEDFVPYLLARSLQGEAYARGTISDGDIRFFELYSPELGSPLGYAIGNHVAPYEASSPKTGWELVNMHPRNVAIRIRGSKTLLRSIILNTHKKCLDPNANLLRLLGRFWKMHHALHAVFPHPYNKLPPYLADHMRTIVDIVAAAASNSQRQHMFLKETQHALDVIRGVRQALGGQATGRHLTRTSDGVQVDSIAASRASCRDRIHCE